MRGWVPAIYLPKTVLSSIIYLEIANIYGLILGLHKSR
jgi:hypothetical protein